ncbi:DUF4262 domain-containing protein [Streptomyces xanthochromogenes]|uniref:DUF4262 domain-containing protein n=1 Tax=Streptomyces xanthochromogenes TaxID=67384 RepID=A0ABQ3AYU2_9ACTN|nr:DUF4262 domain-containing protein [Streptomyces xanthochromogenes]GGY70789.1 hypothetical protein GCM10010326_76250 [Streptomyces xanthochromogenes]
MPTGLTSCHCVVCQDVHELDPRTQSTVDVIQRQGWQVTMVPADAHGPGWAYTVGLWHGRRMPEVAMFGLDVRLMQTILNDLAQHSVEGQPLEAGQERDDVAGVPVVLRAVDYRWYKAFFGTAISYYRKPPFPVLQVVWPNHEGVFPWQAGGEGLLSHQPGWICTPTSTPSAYGPRTCDRTTAT